MRACKRRYPHKNALTKLPAEDAALQIAHRAPISLFTALPSELAVWVIRFVRHGDIPAVQQTCQRLYKLCMEPHARSEMIIDIREAEETASCMHRALDRLTRHASRLELLQIRVTTMWADIPQVWRSYLSSALWKPAARMQLHFTYPRLSGYNKKATTNRLGAFVSRITHFDASYRSSSIDANIPYCVYDTPLPATLQHFGLSDVLVPCGMDSLVSQFPKLTSLSVFVNTSQLHHLFPLCHKLTRLDLVPILAEDRPEVARISIHEFARKLVACRHITVSGSYGPLLIWLCSSAPVVESICIHPHSRVSDDCVMKFTNVDPPLFVSETLGMLEISDMMITDIVLQSIVRLLGDKRHALHTLVFLLCDHAHNVGWRILAACANLRCFRFINSALTPIFESTVRRQLPLLESTVRQQLPLLDVVNIVFVDYAKKTPTF